VRYMLLIYDCERYPDDPEKAAQKQAAMYEYLRMCRERGVLEAADPLREVDTATTVRVRDGETLVVDGPYIETREWLGGYLILDCRGLDEAMELAVACPLAAEGGIEIRPILDVPGLKPETTGAGAGGSAGG
jgi:hypothetical protein